MIGMRQRLWKAIGEALFSDPDNAVAREEAAQVDAQRVAPVVWLLGKTGAGKTAIVVALTGDPGAEVAAEFAPCTRTATFYDLPPEAPLLRFLDTRGLGDVGYDPAEDIAWCERRAHLLLVVMQVDDPVQEPVLSVVREARRRHSEWPLVVAQTGLHRLYPSGTRHPEPYRYTGSEADLSDPMIPHALRQALAYQRKLFGGLPGPPPRFVPVDLTTCEDALPPRDFGLAALWKAIERAAPLSFDALQIAHIDHNN